MFLRKTSGVGITAVALFAVFLLFAACEQPGGVLRDDDATLRFLSVDSGILSPAFSASRSEYRITVRGDVGEIRITAIANSDKATISGTGTTTLNGDNETISVVVSAENGDSKTYTITVKRLDDSVKGIASAEDMAKIGVDADWPSEGKYILLNDITLENWSPICGGDDSAGEGALSDKTGGSTIGKGAFSGVFDGNYHTITLNNFDDKPVGSIYVFSELGTTTATTAYTRQNVFLGIFGALKGAPAARAEVKNLTVHATVNTNPNEEFGAAVGLVAAYGEYAVFDNITLSGTFTSASGLGYAGGVVAIVRGEGTIVKNCTSSVKIDIQPRTGQLIYGIPNPFSWIGGIVGYMEDKVGIENCHTSGDVRGVSTVAQSQVMVGGILGGTYYAFSNSYHGWITDCSSSGNITTGAMHFWPMAGGIAGVICGGHGELEKSTRITRSFATGTVTLENANPANNNQWPYIGGIVGYAYFGAWVSQSYFDGKVIVGRGSDYTGGIAGYSSYATSNKGVPGVIEDCWSDGEVKGFNNAGGIVGQNQANTIIRRSYSRAAVSITNGAANPTALTGTGGIVGAHNSAWNTTPWGDALTGNVALNRSITAAKTYNSSGDIHRIAGRAASTTVVSNNYALPGLLPVADDDSYTADKGSDRLDGEDIPAAYLSGDKPTQAFYVSLGWDFTNVWKMGFDGYPKLKWQK